MPVYEMSAAGSVKVPRVNHQSMNAGNQFGAMASIASTTLAADTGGFTFSNIPQTYQDLFIVISARTNYAGTSDGLHLVLSGTQSSIEMWGSGAASQSALATALPYILIRYGLVGNTATAGIFGSAQIHILNYANTSNFKTALVRTATDTNGAGFTQLVSGLSQSTSGISSFSLNVRNGTAFTAGSTVTVYGIKASSS